MSSKPKPGFDLERLADELESTRVKNSTGGPAFGGFDFDDLRTVFLTAIEWDKSLSEYERERFATRAIFAAATAGKVTKESLLQAVKRLENERLSAPEVDYIVIFSLSLRYSQHLTPVTINGVRFTFHSGLPKNVQTSGIHPANVAGRAITTIEIPESYVVVRCYISAKTVHQAHLRAQSALEVLRAVWNYVINRQTLKRLLVVNPSWKPMNQIRRGPTETIHLKDGSLASQEWWFDPYYYPQEPANFSVQWPQIRKSTAWVLRRTQALNYKDELEIAWIRYAHALDDTGAEGCFLKLWSLLEFVTGTKSANYDEMIRRTLFSCRKRQLHELILQHLRHRRNALVHFDDASIEVGEYAYQLKRYIEEILRLHLAFRGKIDFSSIAEVGEFFSLPFEPAVIEKKRKLFSNALKFRQGTLRQ